jgi:endonuclease III
MDRIERIYQKLEKLISFEPIINKLAKKNASPFEILIATMMSARTKDETTEKAAERLFHKFNTPQKLLKAKVKEIEQLIFPVGFYKTKAKNIIKISSLILNKYKGTVPHTLDELTSLPGVGLKTAALVLSEGFGVDEICVDTHVHRISNRLGLVKTKTPQETYYELKKLLPKKFWRKTNFFFVSYGKTICTPLRPKCSICKISELCPKIGLKA